MKKIRVVGITGREVTEEARETARPRPCRALRQQLDFYLKTEREL